MHKITPSRDTATTPRTRNTKQVSEPARIAAERYLGTVGATPDRYPRTIKWNGRKVTTTWPQILEETAEAIQELHLEALYNHESRYAKKRRAYREQRERLNGGNTPLQPHNSAGQRP